MSERLGMEIYIGDKWWGSAYGDNAKDLRHNGEGLLIKFEGMEQTDKILKEYGKREV